MSRRELFAIATGLVMQGHPQRNLGPCAARYAQLDLKIPAPWLGDNQRLI
ncbi:hypothetical protein [Paraburkholderia sp. BR14320]